MHATNKTNKSKSASVFPVNVSSLASALVDNARAGKEGAFRQKGFLDLIARSQGYANYNAMQASGGGLAKSVLNSGGVQPVKTELAGLSEERVREIATEIYGSAHVDDVQFYNAILAEMRVSISQSSSKISLEPEPSLWMEATLYRVLGEWVDEVGCLVDEKTRRIIFSPGYAYADCEREFVLVQGRPHHVVRNPANKTIAFALSCAEHFYAAVSDQVDLLSAASVYRFDGVLVEYGMNGDWAEEVESAFDNTAWIFEASPDEMSEYEHEPQSLSEALRETSVWFAEGTVDFDKYEFYVNALDLLFSKVTGKNAVIIPSGDEPGNHVATVTCLS